MTKIGPYYAQRPLYPQGVLKVPVGDNNNLLAPLQALVVLDYRLIIVKRTAAVVQLGRRGGRLGLVLISAPPLLSIPNLLCGQTQYIMTLGNWNGMGCLGHLKSVSSKYSVRNIGYVRSS